MQINTVNTVNTVPAEISRGPFRKSYRNSVCRRSRIRSTYRLLSLHGLSILQFPFLFDSFVLFFQWRQVSSLSTLYLYRNNVSARVFVLLHLLGGNVYSSKIMCRKNEKEIMKRRRKIVSSIGQRNFLLKQILT